MRTPDLRHEPRSSSRGKNCRHCGAVRNLGDAGRGRPHPRGMLGSQGGGDAGDDPSCLRSRGATWRTGQQPDWRNPLANRWLRLWTWPYGKQAKDVHMDASAAACAIGRRAERLAREAVRLLYVGTTRARDHLVLTTAGVRRPRRSRSSTSAETPTSSCPSPGVTRSSSAAAPIPRGA